jgi:phage terminase large subunit GpA-like protein
VSEWADRERMLSPEASAEPGRWITSRAEYQRGIMDAVSDPQVETVVVIKSAQVGWTEIINNVVGFHIAQDPAPLLVVQPTLEMGQAWSKDRLAPMLRDTPQLSGLVSDPRSRDGENTLLHKSFPGGHLTIAGANSAAGLASRPIRVLLFDEVDRYPVSAGTEGDPVTLGRKRTATFWNRKILMGSTPTVAGASRIEVAFEQSDQRRYFVPCPHCGEMQSLRWDQVRWPEGEPQRAAYHCEACGTAWTDAQRWGAVRKGEWRATAPFAGVAGFHISEIYSTWRRLAETVSDFLGAKDRPEMLRAWVNTALGETWQEAADAPDWERIAARRESGWQRGELPKGVLFLTHATDVQGDRLEWDVWGWGEDFTAWLVDSGVVEGSPHEAAAWTRLRETQARLYRDVWGREWPIDAAGVDSGFAAQEVYRFVANHPDRERVFALDGRGEIRAAPIGAPSRRAVKYDGTRDGTVALWPVGTHGLKLAHYAALRRSIEGGDSGGLVRLPEWVPAEYARQLTAEVLAYVQPRTAGPAKPQWRRVANVRNERLDTAVYARALAHHLTAQLTHAEWAALKRRRGPPDAPLPAVAAPQPPPPPASTPWGPPPRWEMPRPW